MEGWEGKEGKEGGEGEEDEEGGEGGGGRVRRVGRCDPLVPPDVCWVFLHQNSCSSFISNSKTFFLQCLYFVCVCVCECVIKASTAVASEDESLLTGVADSNQRGATNPGEVRTLLRFPGVTLATPFPPSLRPHHSPPLPPSLSPSVLSRRTRLGFPDVSVVLIQRL